MPEETNAERVDRLFRDHVGYTGDGQGGDGALPTGDRSTSLKKIEKRDLREVFRPIAAAADELGDAVGAASASAASAQVDAAAAADDAAAAGTSSSLAALAAKAAGAALFSALSAGEAATSPGDVFMVQMEPGTAVYENVGGAGDLLGWLGEVLFEDPASLKNSGLTGFKVDQTIRTRVGGHAFKVGPAVLAAPHLTTDGNVRLMLEKGAGGEYAFAALAPAADEVTDDTPKLQALVNTTEFGGLITVPPGNFRIEGLEMKSGVKLRGAGFERNVAAARTTKGGTRFMRTTGAKMIRAEGVGIRSGNYAPISYCGIEGIMIDGSNIAVDIMTMYACVTWTFRDVMFTGCEGARWIDMREVWDTHFEFSRLEQGGSADGVFPGIEMISGTADGVAWEQTNQIFFIATVFENFPGYSIRGTSNEAGYYTNEIYFTATKIESARTDLTLPILSLRKMRTVVLNGLNLSARGQAETAISAMLELNDTFGVHGTLQAEFITGGADWGAFVYGTNSGDVDLTVRAYGAYAPTSGFAVQHDGANANSYHVRCLAESGIVTRALNTPSTLGDVVQLYKRSGSPYFQFRDGAIADPWAIDIPADGAGTKWRVLHNGVSALEVLNSNRLRALGGIQSDAPVQMPDYTVADLPDVSTWQRSWIYVLDEVGGPVMAFSDGTNWRRSTDRAIVS